MKSKSVWMVLALMIVGVGCDNQSPNPTGENTATSTGLDGLGSAQCLIVSGGSFDSMRLFVAPRIVSADCNTPTFRDGDPRVQLELSDTAPGTYPITDTCEGEGCGRLLLTPASGTTQTGQGTVTITSDTNGRVRGSATLTVGTRPATLQFDCSNLCAPVVFTDAGT
jgi:hypothetical protein